MDKYIQNRRFYWLRKKEIWFFLACLSILFMVQVLEYIHFEKSLYNLSNPSLSKNIRSESSDTDPQVSIANYILADSVLSAVQTYYVESSRVSVDVLFDVYKSAMNSIRGIKLEINSDRLSMLSDNQEKLEFSLNSHRSYSSLLTVMLRSSYFIKKNAFDQLPELVKKEIDQGDVNQPMAYILDLMLSELDPHSAILSRQSYQDLKEGTEGSFGGLGVLVGTKDRSLNIVKLLPGGTALEAGLRINDKILKIDDQETFGRSLDSLIEYMRGEPGSKVQMTVLHADDVAPRNYLLERRIIDVNSVHAEYLPLDKSDKFLLQIRIDNFSVKTAQEVERALILARRQKQKSLAGIILDLRSNPGGLLDQAAAVADLFVKKGIIVSTDGRLEDTDYASNRNKFNDLPVFVWMNQESASASEILAGALQDHQRALVIGQPSFGKGSVQTIFELPNSRALKLTIARYYTPNGNSIQNDGIYPDIWVQEVQKRDKNINLFGNGRYQGENNLRNHLLRSSSLTAKGSDYIGKIKGFKYVDSNYAEAAPAETLEFAISSLISRVLLENKHIPLEPAFDRASYWLNLSLPKIQKMLDSWSQTTFAELESKHKVNWSGVSTESIKIDFEAKLKNASSIKQGDELDIEWRLKNSDKRSTSRVSVYLYAANGGVGSQEILVGELAPGASKSGNFKFKVYGASAGGKLKFTAGYALDSQAVYASEQSVMVEFGPTSPTKIRLSYKLTDEQLIPDGVLQPREKATILIKVLNDGSRDLKDIKMDLVNLSGKQFTLKSDLPEIKELKAHHSRTLQIPIEAASSLLSEEVKFGFIVDAKGLNIPAQELCSLPTVNSQITAQRTNTFAH